MDEDKSGRPSCQNVEEYMGSWLVQIVVSGAQGTSGGVLEEVGRVAVSHLVLARLD